MSISKINVSGTEHELIASGLTDASAEKIKLNYTNIAYGTCSTAADTAAKVVTVNGNTNWALTNGSLISVYFSYTNTASNPTLNVNGTGAKNIYYGSSQITTSSLGYAGTASRMMNFMYDGTQYRFIGWGYDSNTTYTNVKLGHGYTTCSTAAATTAKTASLSSYTLTTGGIVVVKFTYAVPASATLNINSKGAKAIYHKGAAIAANVIKAGDTATFIYNGSQYHLISLDRDDNTTYSVATTSANGLMSSTDKSKLDGIASGANAYTHPTYTARTGKPTANQTPAFGGTATVSQITSDSTGHVTGATDRTITIPSTLSNGTGTAGLIKTSSTVTSSSGYTACPVISGVPYYKDTDTNTKVTNTLGTTTKYYITGTTSATTNTGTQYFDTGIYSTTTAGQLRVTSLLVADKFTISYDSTADAMKVSFV